MPLIQCPECGGKVSDRAPACPHCGCPVEAKPAAPEPQPARESADEQPKTSTWGRKLVSAVGVVVLLLCCAAIRGIVRTAMKKTRPPTTSAMPVTAEEAARQFAEGMNAVPLEELRKTDSSRLIKHEAYAKGHTVYAIRTYDTDGVLSAEMIYDLARKIDESLMPAACSWEEIKLGHQAGVEHYVKYVTFDGQFIYSALIDKEICNKKKEKSSFSCFAWHIGCFDFCWESYKQDTTEHKQCEQYCDSGIEYCTSKQGTE